MRYFHLSPLFRRFEIALNGLDPAYDARKKGRVWFCDQERIDEIGFHLAKRDNAVVISYACWFVDLEKAEIKANKSGRAGVYWVSSRVSNIWCEYLGEIMYDLQDGFAITWHGAPSRKPALCLVNT